MDNGCDEKLLLAWDIVSGLKVTAPVHERKAALLYLHVLVDRELAKLGEEMGHGSLANNATDRLPSPPPSLTGEQVGHIVCAAARLSLPPASPASSDDAGHISRAHAGRPGVAPSSTPNKAGEGRGVHASKRHDLVAPPALVPTASQRAGAARAMATAAPRAVAKTILDTWKLRGGISIGDARYAALEQIQMSSELEVAVIQNIRNYGIPHDKSMRVRDYLTAKQVMEAVKLAERRFHNVA